MPLRDRSCWPCVEIRTLQRNAQAVWVPALQLLQRGPKTINCHQASCRRQCSFCFVCWQADAKVCRHGECMAGSECGRSAVVEPRCMFPAVRTPSSLYHFSFHATAHCLKGSECVWQQQAFGFFWCVEWRVAVVPCCYEFLQIPCQRTKRTS